MNEPDDKLLADDVRALHRLGYAQELARCLGGFANFALSFSIICILAGCVTSFHIGFCSVGGAAIGLGWPLVCLFSLAVAATMGQVASAFPTAGGLYHWAAILGGRGWGWATAWFNLAGLITVLAAINVGAYQFAQGAFFPDASPTPIVQCLVMLLMTATQAAVNHLGMRFTSWLTNFSGYWILLVALILTMTLLAAAPVWDWRRLVAFTNYSGLPAKDPVWPPAPTPWLFALGFLLPAYTITGFDASAHAAEETVGAGRRVPRGIVGSVLTSSLAGWALLVAVVLAIPNLDEAANAGDGAFVWTLRQRLPEWLVLALCAAIAVAQYLCGLATVTSASRMAFAFARDGGLPFSSQLRWISPTFRTPALAVWTVAAAAVLFTVYTPVYSTITAVCVIFLYISYVVPTALGLIAYRRRWTHMGPWQLGRWFRPLAVVSVFGCLGLIVIGMQPPNEKAVWVVGGLILVLLVAWFGLARHRFAGPPHGVLQPKRRTELHAAEQAVHQEPIPEDKIPDVILPEQDHD
jgi:amino acid transporter